MVLKFFFILGTVNRNNMMGENGEWDKGLMDSFKDFNLNSPEVKQQFGRFELNYSLLYFSMFHTFG